MGSKVSLSHSQLSTTCPYPRPDRSSSSPPHSTSLRSSLILCSHLCLGLPSGLFPSGFPTKTPYTSHISPIRNTCPAYHIILDLITRTILGEWYCSLSSSLCSCILSTGKMDTPSPVLIANCITSSEYNTATQVQYSVLTWNSTNWSRCANEKRKLIHFVFSSLVSDWF
jgi:hypothetical protein